jgi:transcriptional regulator with XRE-family HTH domain
MPHESLAQRVVEDLKVEIFRGGKSQQQLADAAGSSPAWVQRRLSGEVEPTISDLTRIAAAANVDVVVELRRRDLEDRAS